MGDSGVSIFTLRFADDRTALAARVDRPEDVTRAVHAFGLTGAHPVVVVAGGAGGMEDADMDQMRPLLAEGLIPAISASDAAVVDGGTDIGVMRLMGQARDGFTLIGVAVERTVVLPGQAPRSADAAPLESHHTHFLLVPGTGWGDEVPWLARTATVLAGDAPSVTVLINGGQTSLDDAEHSLRGGRPVVVLAGTGRAADQIAAARRGDRSDAGATSISNSPQVYIADASDPGTLRQQLTSLLSAVPRAGSVG